MRHASSSRTSSSSGCLAARVQDLCNARTEGDLPGRVQQHVVGDRTLAEQLLAGGPEQLQVSLRVRAVALDVPDGLLQRQGQVPQFVRQLVRYLLGQLGDLSLIHISEPTRLGMI